MHAPTPWPAALRPAGPWLLALLISLLGHALWLAPPRVAPAPMLVAPPPSSLRIVTVAPRAAPQPEPPPPAPAPRLPAAAPQAAVATPAPAEAPAVEAAPDGPGAAVAGVAAVAAELPDPQQFHFRLLLREQEGEATLRWESDGERYRLLLQRHVAGRELPEWQSEGLLGASGLQPQRFEVRRKGRLRQGIQLHPPVQDRLSWLLQLAAVAQARDPEQPLPPLAIDLAGWRGGVQRWVFAPVEGEASEMPRRLLHLRGQHPVDARYRIDVWLDPARGHMPRRWVQSFDEELRTELQLIDRES